MPLRIRRWLYRIADPLKHDPAWFELTSIMGAIVWALLGLASDYDFRDWPSMDFLASYFGDAPLYLSLALGIAQGIALFGGFAIRRSVRLRMIAACITSWWWFFLGLSITTSLPAINPHVALYLVLGLINLMALVRLGKEAG